MLGTRAADHPVEEHAELADRRRSRLELVEYDLVGDRAVRRIAELGSRWAAWFVDADANRIDVLRYR